MGWAKYYEDNVEIICERQDQRFTLEKDIFFQGIAILTEKPYAIVEEKQQDFNNRYLICEDCGCEFIFSSHMQKFYSARGWGAPKRCKSCREHNDIMHIMRVTY